MAKKALNVLKEFFLGGLIPTQEQFEDTLDSFLHKDEGVPYNGASQNVFLGENSLFTKQAAIGSSEGQEHDGVLSVNNKKVPGETSTIFAVNSSTDILGLHVLEDSTGVLHVNNRGGGSMSETNTTFGVNANTSPNPGVDNTSIGYLVLGDNNGGSCNTAIGRAALQATTLGMFNTAVGQSAGGDISTGNANTLAGRFAGKGLTTGAGNLIITPRANIDDIALKGGSFNTFIGRVTGYTDSTSNVVAIADGSSNKVVEAKANDTLGVKLKGKFAATSFNDIDADNLGNVTVPLLNAENYPEIYYPEVNYTGIITWGGTTAPSGTLTAKWQGQRVRKRVVLYIHINYSVRGTGLTSLTVSLPAGAPVPKDVSQLSGSPYMWPISGWLHTSPQSGPGSSISGGLTKNGSTYDLVMIGSPSSYNGGIIEVNYLTN